MKQMLHRVNTSEGPLGCELSMLTTTLRGVCCVCKVSHDSQ